MNPLPEEGLIESTDPVALLNEARERCFRVTEIRWLEALQHAPYAWGLRVDNEGQRLLEHLPDSIDFTGDLPSWIQRVGWQMKGVDERGWVRDQASLVIPPRNDQSGVRIKIRARARNSEIWRARLGVVIPAGVGEDVVNEIDGESYYLEVPTPEANSPMRVEFRWHDLDIPGEAEAEERSDASNFRVQRIEWKKQLATRHLPEATERWRLRTLDALKALPQRAPAKSGWRKWFSRSS